MVSNEPKKKRWNCEISKFQKKNLRLPFVHYISLYILLILPQFYLAEQLHLSVATWLDGSRDGQPSASWALRKAYVGSEWIEEKKKTLFQKFRLHKHAKPIQNPRVFLVSRFNRSLGVFGRSLLTLVGTLDTWNQAWRSPHCSSSCCMCDSCRRCLAVLASGMSENGG